MVTGLETGDSGPNGFDDAGAFVAQYRRERPGDHTVDHRKVAVAHPGGSHFHQHFTFLRPGQLHIFHLQLAAQLVQYGRSDFHIELIDVHKGFGPKTVLDGINLEVKRGQSMVVIGGSGTGKSVMLKCIIGLMVPTSGTIRLDGQEVGHLPQHDRDSLMSKFGMLFQGGALFDSLPVWENVAFRLIQGGGMDRDLRPGLRIC